MKKCNTCGIEKEEKEFFKKKENSLEGFCKECKKEKLRKKKELDPEKYLEKERLRSEKRRKTEEWKEWRKDYEIRNRIKITKKSVEAYNRCESYLEKQKEWKKLNKDKLKVYNKNARLKNPFKVAARSYVCAAIKVGIIVRPETCERCMRVCKAEAHHEDYMKPLDVKWLCRSCHGFEHRKTK